eukprot:11453726-Ditylum_brightwellii.AAC.2
MLKKTDRRGVAYTVAKKIYLVTNIRLVEPISNRGWEMVHSMHHTVYAHKNQTVESLSWCFTNLYYTKAPSGDPSIPIEVREAKMTWLQIRAKLEYSIYSNDEEDGGNNEGVDEVDEDDYDNESQ